MGKKIVIALGGNALGNNLEEQVVAVKTTSKAIVDLIEAGNEVIVVHGNGPQVGMINNVFNENYDLHKNDGASYIPLANCGAMSQAYIGFDLQNALREECLNRGVKVNGVATVLTQVVVDKADPAFQKPTKPVGQFMTKEKADEMAKSKNWTIVEDSGRGYRRVVPSPLPKEIAEIDAIKTMLANKTLVICCGGGGIPVTKEGNKLIGCAAVIDKDSAAELLAENIDADFLIILTAVEKVAINFGKPNQENLSKLSVQEAKKHAADGQFAPGSMLPKVNAAIKFAESKKGRSCLITLLEKAKDGIEGKTGTVISD